MRGALFMASFLLGCTDGGGGMDATQDGAAAADGALPADSPTVDGTIPDGMPADAMTTDAPSFDAARFTLQLDHPGGGGVVLIDPPNAGNADSASYTYDEGTTVTLTQFPHSCHHFDGWGGACAGATGDTCVLVIGSDVTVSVSFSPDAYYTLDVTPIGAGGTITSDPPGISCGADCSETYPACTGVALTATTTPGTHFAGWTGACSGQCGCSVSLTGNTTVGAVFEPARLVSFTHFVGYDTEIPYAVLGLPDGGMYVVGTLNANMIIGDDWVYSAGAVDVFIIRLAATGEVIWGRRIGGAGTEFATGAAVDASGNVAVVGTFEQTVDFGGTAATTSTTNAYVAKYHAADGTLDWVRTLSATYGSEARGVAFDGDGDVVVTGGVRGAVDLGGGADSNMLSTSDAFIAEYEAADGQHIWSRRLGSDLGDVGNDVAIAPDGSIFVVGQFMGVIDVGCPTNLFGAGTTADGFVIEYAPGGACQWKRALGGNYYDDATAVDVAGGDVIVGGEFYESINLGDGILTGAGGLSGNGFVARYGGDGTYRWADDLVLAASDLSTSTIGHAYVVGRGASISDYASDGSLVWSRQYPACVGGGTPYGTAVDVAPSGDVLMGVYFGSGPVNFGNGSVSTYGSYDAAVLRLLP